MAITSLENSFDVFKYTTAPREEVRKIFGEAIRDGLRRISVYDSLYLIKQFDLPWGLYDEIYNRDYRNVTGRIFNNFTTPLNLLDVRDSVFRKDFSDLERREIIEEFGKRGLVSFGPNDDDSKLQMILILDLIEQL